MKVPRLDAIQISNFRCIRGMVSIPLDAPVVLLHGTNGAGKSTVMSAIELALTGDMSGIAETDRGHLVHHDEKEATVELASSEGKSTLRLRDGELSGEPLLASDDARFFAERCYLEQRTLTRLLEIYQGDGEAESLLTRFVNDLLGLDELEALLEGLDPLTEKYRLRKTLPEYATLEEERKGIQQTLEQLQRQAAGLVQARTESTASLSELLGDLGVSRGSDDEVESFLDRRSDEAHLVEWKARRQDVLALQRRAREVGGAPEAKELATLTKAVTEARNAVKDWREKYGRRLDDVLGGLRQRFPSLPDATTAQDPAAVRRVALAEADAELTRLRSGLAADRRARTELQQLDAAAADARARVVSIDTQLAESSSATEAEELAKTLAALVPHVHTDDCPVCGRAFGEISREPLVAHLAMRVSQLSEHAERLSSLSKARLEAVNDVQRLHDARSQAQAGLMEREAREVAEAELAFLEEAHGRLVGLERGVTAGASLTRSLADTERALVFAEERARGYAELVAAVGKIAAASGDIELDVERVDEALSALVDGFVDRIAQAEQVERLRAKAREKLLSSRMQAAESRKLNQEIAKVETALRELKNQITTLDERRKDLWNLQRDAERARTTIIRKVFNDALNAVWRDLFVRLAPEEPFMPAFRTADTRRGRLVAQLVTTYRGSDVEAGSPSAMLSAGNLNTAALTLFLALHLSVNPHLPWLLLDDPVQSMDEVHIQQFAALLRTLSKGHGRRLIIAVHERALFDYLSLELSAAQPDDVLVTAELSRSYEGTTVVRPSRLQYVPDLAFETEQTTPAD